MSTELHSEVVSASTLATPDPLLSSEGIAATIVTAVADIYVLFGSNLSNARQTALAGAITSIYTMALLAYTAYTRGSRAKAGGLVQFTAPIQITDASDAVELRHRGK